MYCLKLFNEVGGVDGVGIVREIDQMPDRLAELASRPGLIPPMQMVESDGRLNQSLIKDSDRSGGNPPEILPVFVSLEVVSGVKKMKAFFERVLGWHGL